MHPEHHDPPTTDPTGPDTSAAFDRIISAPVRPGRRGCVSVARPVAIALLWTGFCLAAGLVLAAVAHAGTGIPSPAPGGGVEELNTVMGNFRNVLMGVLVSLATLFATIGGIRYLLAGGDPTEVESAKKTLKYGGLGYAVAILAPVLVTIMQQIVGQ